MTLRPPARRQVAFLHTARTNIRFFEAAAGAGSTRLTWAQRHDVRPDLLAALDSDACERDAALQETRGELSRLAQGADAVVLTCSSLGPACEDWSEAPGALFRADEALALSSTSKGGRVLALYAAPSSEEPTVQLFQAAATMTSASVECRLVKGAWSHFLAGRHEDYADTIAQVALSEHARFDVVALAQTSMATAVDRLGPHNPVRTVPDAVMARLDALFSETSAAADQADARRT